MPSALHSQVELCNVGPSRLWRRGDSSTSKTQRMIEIYMIGDGRGPRVTSTQRICVRGSARAFRDVGAPLQDASASVLEEVDQRLVVASPPLLENPACLKQDVCQFVSMMIS